MLLDSYKVNHTLTETRAELYARASRNLIDASRRGGATTSMTGFSMPELLCASERVAAVTILCGQETVWDPEGGAPVPNGTVSIEDLCGGEETWRSGPAADIRVELSEALIRATLGSGLFSASGERGFTWSHHTYGEFLAAQYVVQNRPDAALQLVTARQDGLVSLVPQLRDVAAWFADLEPSVHEKLLALDPAALTRADLVGASEAQKESLAAALLDVAHTRRLDHLRRTDLLKLRGSGVASLAWAVLADKTRDLRTRMFALELVEECAGDQLDAELIELVLDDSENHRLRVAVTYGLTDRLDPPALVSLRPLLDSSSAEDPDESLKGCVLRRLWPTLLTVHEVLGCLKPPRQPNVYGSYRRFLEKDFVAGLEQRDMPQVLAWIRTQPPAAGAMADLHDAVIAAGISSMSNADVAPELAATIVVLINRDHTFSQAPPGDGIADQLGNPDVRRELMIYLLPHIASGEISARILSFSHPQLVMSDDLQWLIDRVGTSREPAEKDAWTQLVVAVCNFDDPDQAQLVINAARSSGMLADAIRPFTRAVELSSEEAHAQRERYERRVAREEERLASAAARAPSLGMVSDALARFETGETNAWLSVTAQLGAIDGRVSFTGDLRRRPLWAEMDQECHERVISAAALFLNQADPANDQWFLTKNVPYIAGSACQAIMLTLHESPTRLDSLSPQVWKRWLPTIVRVSMMGVDEDSDERVTLRSKAYSAVPDDFIRCVLALAQHEATEHGFPVALRIFHYLWDEHIEGQLLQQVKDGAGHPAVLLEVSRLLLERDVAAAFECLAELVPTPPPSDPGSRTAAAMVGALLMVKANGGFAHVWTAAAGDEEFAGEVLTRVALHEERLGIELTSHLNEEELATLFLWLARHYPYEEDADDDDDVVSSAAAMRDLRGAVLVALQTRGSTAAVFELQGLRDELPELEWLGVVQSEALEAWGRASWVRRTPAEVIGLSADPRSQFVDDGADLIRVLVAAIGRAVDYLHGENQAMSEVWNTGSTYRPKTEPELSDWLVRRLRGYMGHRLVVLNREVEVRRGSAAGLGDRTDIYVRAWSDRPGEREAVTVVIEVKGSWNRELMIALKDQLIDQYLCPVGLRHGIYLVGWFDSERWDPADERRNTTRRLDQAVVRRELEEQARAYSEDLDLVVGSIVLDLEY